MTLPFSNYNTRDNNEDIDIDLDMFNSIMQEQPPDPGKLSHEHLVGPSSSLFTHTHTSLDQSTSCLFILEMFVSHLQARAGPSS